MGSRTLIKHVIISPTRPEPTDRDIMDLLPPRSPADRIEPDETYDFELVMCSRKDFDRLLKLAWRELGDVQSGDPQ